MLRLVGVHYVVVETSQALQSSGKGGTRKELIGSRGSMTYSAWQVDALGCKTLRKGYADSSCRMLWNRVR